MYSKNLKTVPANNLKYGDVFVKVLGGNPCLIVLNYVASYGDVVEAETYDGCIKTMSKFQLVHVL